MNLQTIAEHTVDMDLLPEKANILDAGCRGFEFADYFRSIGHNVFPIDIDDFKSEREDYWILALVGEENFINYVGVRKTSDPQATSVCYDGNNAKVKAVSIKTLCFVDKIEMYDLIKLDIETSEYEVITSMSKAYATQISVEFHTHCGQTEQQVQECVDKLHSLGYKTIQHEKTARHGLKPNYWDSLFTL